jgi:hypothetical protein
MTPDEYRRLTRQLLNEVVEINKKWDFAGYDGRSEEDNARSEYLWGEMERIAKQLDEDNPLPPCPDCGHQVRASRDGVCTNWPNCKSCPPLGG